MEFKMAMPKTFSLRSMLRATVGVVGALCLTATTAQAGTIVFNNPAAAGTQTGWLLGMDFDVVNAVTVTQLGAFDSLGNGFGAGSIQVGIFDVGTGALVGSSATLTGNDGTLIGGSRFVSVTPFLLTPGSYSIVAVGFTDQNSSGNSQSTAGASFNDVGGNLNLVAKGGRWESSADFKLPTANVGGYNQPDPVFHAGTFSVPDGGMTLTLLGGALAGLGLFRRRRQA